MFRNEPADGENEGHKVAPGQEPPTMEPVETQISEAGMLQGRITNAIVAAQHAYALSRRCSRTIGPALTGDPGFNMLLDLFLSKFSERKLSVTAVCLGSRVANATALRYLMLLQNAGYVERIADDLDRRRSYIVLTGMGFESMIKILNPDGIKTD